MQLPPENPSIKPWKLLERGDEQPVAEEALSKIAEFMIANFGLFKQLGRYFKWKEKEKAESFNWQPEYDGKNGKKERQPLLCIP